MMNNGYSIEVIFGAFRKIESKIGNYKAILHWRELHVKKILPYFLAKKQNEDQTSSSS